MRRKTLEDNHIGRPSLFVGAAEIKGKPGVVTAQLIGAVINRSKV